MNWTSEERKFIEENYGRMTQRQIARALHRGEGTISRMIELLDLQKPRIRKDGQERKIPYPTLQWKKGKHLQTIWHDIRPTEVHMGQGS